MISTRRWLNWWWVGCAALSWPASGAQSSPASALPQPTKAPQDSPPNSPKPVKAQDSTKTRTTQECIEALGDPSFEVREAAYADLAGAGVRVRAELEAAADHRDPEVRWRVARLLHELDGLGTEDHGPGALHPVEPDSAPALGDPQWRRELPAPLRSLEFDTVRSMMDEMRHLLDGTFEGDPGELRGFFRGRPFQFRFFDDAFGTLDQVARSIQSRAEAPGPGSHFTRRERDGERERRIDVRIDEEGRVRVEVEEEGTTTVTDSGSWQELEETRPELVQRIQGGSGAENFFEVSGFPWGPRIGAKENDLALRPIDEAVATGPVLGVRVDVVHPALRDYLELAPDDGLMIVVVVPGSLAEQLGIQPKDILLELGDRVVHGVEDVRLALLNRQGALDRAVVLRRGQERVLSR